jgi:hypothetical protein
MAKSLDYLPVEIRCAIYKELFRDAMLEIPDDCQNSSVISTKDMGQSLAVLRTSKQIHEEAKQILFESITLNAKHCLRGGPRPQLPLSLIYKIENIILTPCLRHEFDLTPFTALKRLELTEFAHDQGDAKPHFAHGLAEFKIDSKDSQVARNIFDGAIDQKLKQTCQSDLTDTWLGGLLNNQNHHIQIIHCLYVFWMKSAVAETVGDSKLQYGSLVIKYDAGSLDTISRKALLEFESRGFEKKVWTERYFEWLREENVPSRWRTLERREAKLQDQLTEVDECLLANLEIGGSALTRRSLIWKSLVT